MDAKLIIFKTMKHLSSIFFILFCTTVFIQTQAQEKNDINDRPEISARPLGGYNAFLGAIDQNIIYSKEAQASGTKGVLDVEFIVEKDGQLSSIHITDSIGGDIADSLKSTIARLPAWKPGMVNGISVRTKQKIHVPIDVKKTAEKRWMAEQLGPRVVEAQPNIPINNNIVDTFDIEPEPPGGMAAFRTWIGQNYNYPLEATRNKVNGTIIIRFVVNKDGRLSDYEVVKNLGYGTAEEAIRVIKKSRPWKPAIAEGQPVRAEFTFPIILNTH